MRAHRNNFDLYIYLGSLLNNYPIRELNFKLTTIALKPMLDHYISMTLRQLACARDW